jgi:hypothetical protein
LRRDDDAAKILIPATSKQNPRGPGTCGEKPLTGALVEGDGRKPWHPSALLFRTRKQITARLLESESLSAGGWLWLYTSIGVDEHDWCLIHMLADKTRAAKRAEGGES